VTTRALLRRPGFRSLAITYGLSELVDWLTTIALAVLVYEATNSALATTVLFVASKFVPAFAAPAITSRVDAVSPRRSLPMLYTLQASAFGGMMRSLSRAPSDSSDDQPKVSSAIRFQPMTWPSSAITMTASSAVSSTD